MLGATIAILCAFTWSLSVILFKKAGAAIHPVVLNLLKNSLALVLIVPTIFVVEGALPPGALTGHDLLVLLLSGLFGIGLADAMVLKALHEIGASRVAVIECTYSPFVIFLSVLFLGESLSGIRIFGATLIVAALLCVSVSREALEAPRGKILAGVRWGILGLFSMAAGIVVVKPIFAHLPLFWIIGIRLVAGVAASIVLFLFLPEKRQLLGNLRFVERKALVFFACFLSTYVSMMLWVAGYKFNDATIAAVLNQTSTFFTVGLAAVILKERFTPAKAAGTVLAVTGVLVMAFA